MLRHVKVRINILEIDRQCMCHKIRVFSYNLISKMNNEHFLDGKYGQVSAAPTVSRPNNGDRALHQTLHS